MKNRRYTYISHLALAAVMAILLSACGNSTPSESNAKAVIQSQLDGCPYLSLEDFKKSNGIPGDDPNSYRVDVAYTLRFKPSDDERDSMKQWGTLMKQQAALNQQEEQDLNAASAKYTSGTDESAAAMKEVEDRYKDRQDDLKQQLSQTLDARSFLNSLPDKCSDLPRSFWMNFFANDQDIKDMVRGGVEKSYTDTISMTRTDNGWQAAR
ncbi:hypothetical protein [Paraburkholderia sp. BCC1885]|uniref:hypothetical protein n=1 Tax=Paraburkholderia sp. BCC1885 TaxID=2562669 RepID=UPI001182D3FD|nr:hypothetical protein [Paraburkholderia sp. BCC1885]